MEHWVMLHYPLPWTACSIAKSKDKSNAVLLFVPPAADDSLHHIRPWRAYVCARFCRVLPAGERHRFEETLRIGGSDGSMGPRNNGTVESSVRLGSYRYLDKYQHDSSTTCWPVNPLLTLHLARKSHCCLVSDSTLESLH